MQFIFILLLALTFENEVWGLLEGLQIKPPPAKYGFEEPPNYQGVEEGKEAEALFRPSLNSDFFNYSVSQDGKFEPRLVMGKERIIPRRHNDL